MSSERLPIKMKLGFGVCDLGQNLFFTLVAFLLLNYLTDTVGIAAGLAGIVLAIAKIWDAISDPIVGFLSDRTSTTWGRRRPYLFYGSFLLFITMIIMFTNPAIFMGPGWIPGDHQLELFIWALLSYSLLCTAYTLVNIPYGALIPELTQDYHEKTSLNGYRYGFAVIGTILGAGIALPLIGTFPTINIGYMGMGIIYGALMMSTALITVYVVREKECGQLRQGEGFLATYKKVFKNKPYFLILLTYTLHVTALTIVSGIAIYYFKYIHQAESKITFAMLILLVTAMFFIPVSVLLAKKIGKKLVYGIGMALFSAGIFLLFIAGHLYDISFSYATMVLSGIGMGFTYVMPHAMMPDTIEYDYLLTGVRREGAFYGIWTFGTKIGQAVALAITGFVLSLFGYIPDVVQTESAKFGIRLLLGPIPIFIFALGIIACVIYPINERKYIKILDDIKEKGL